MDVMIGQVELRAVICIRGMLEMMGKAKEKKKNGTPTNWMFCDRRGLRYNIAI
jgi:hypothetical protein